MEEKNETRTHLSIGFWVSGLWQIGRPFNKQAVQKELEEFRSEYENAVRQRSADSVLSFYDDKLRSEMRDYWKLLLAGEWGRMPFLDEQQTEDYSSFKQLMAICEAEECEATAVLAHDTGYPFINRYFLVSKYGPDVYRLAKKKGRWRISSNTNRDRASPGGIRSSGTGSRKETGDDLKYQGEKW